MLLLLLNYAVLRALRKIYVHLISILVNKSIFYQVNICQAENIALCVSTWSHVHTIYYL